MLGNVGKRWAMNEHARKVVRIENFFFQSSTGAVLTMGKNIDEKSNGSCAAMGMTDCRYFAPPSSGKSFLKISLFSDLAWPIFGPFFGVSGDFFDVGLRYWVLSNPNR